MIWHNVLSEARKFNAIDTAPELRHQFCALWNDLVDVAQDSQRSSMARANAIHILSLIRTAYLPLHHGTRSAPVAYSASTDDHDPILLVGTSYTRCTVEYHQPPILDAIGSIPPSSAEKTTFLDPEPTPSVSQLPAVDDTDTDRGLLTLAMRKALPDDSRVRILVVGKPGSGKSSLIDSIFKTSTAAMSHHEFGHDIETEYYPDDNPQLIFHVSSGFPSWDETSLQTIQDFVTGRTGAKRPESRRLDAIWLCISIPDTIHGRIEGVKEVLRIGKVPVVVVFTKFDEIIYTPQHNPNTSDVENTQISQLARDAAHEQCRILCRSLFDKDPGELPAVNVSVLQEHDNLIKELIKMTDKIITDPIRAPMPEWSIEQKGSRDLKIDASIEPGGEMYWRSLWSSIDLKGQQLHDCLITLHVHIVSLWNLSDRSQYLSSDEFKAKMSHLVADLAGKLVTSSSSVPTTSLKVAPSSSGGLTAPRTQDLTALMSSVHQSIIIPCVIGYMIDLTVILHELSKSIGNVSPRDVQFAVTEHVISGRQKRIHRTIRSFILETSTVKVIQEDVVVEMIIDLTEEFLVSPDS
ncbi:hypothetical protein BJV78DRAFT_1206839 [Lactifluus subvellereus]|nr:hypothetical protein BJV78DRAFT_1206839 [Lactifluus subvellereus]